MLHKLRKSLRKITFLHSLYMRIKRGYTRELLGMTTKAEQEYFTNYGKSIYEGKGEVVDLGCWLGSTTIPLVKGLLENPHFTNSNRKVFAYDAFVWYEGMNDSVAGSNLFNKYKTGDSFLSEYKKRTQKYASYIEIYAGDLKMIGWNKGNIEFLLVDAMKNWELTNSILKDFYTHLVPNKSLVLHQDFSHFFTPWIHLLQWNFREYFEFSEEVPKSSSVVFKYVKKIPHELLKKNYSFESFSDDDLNNAIDYSLQLVSSEKKANIIAAKIMSFIHQNRLSDAQRVLDNYLHQGIMLEKDLLIIKQMLDS